MRKLLLASTVALSLGGCATDPTTGQQTIDQAQIAATIAQVQAITQQVCGYLPVASTVAEILASFVGAGGVVGVASQAAQGICNAVTSPKLGGVAKYRGVVIHGRFVAK